MKELNPSVFVLRADFGRYTDTFEKEGYIGIGWFTEDPIGWDLILWMLILWTIKYD